jgi:hypothetical protein
MPPRILNVGLGILLLFIVLRNNHVLLAILHHLYRIAHINVSSRQLPAIPPHILHLRTLHIKHILSDMFHAFHDSFAFEYLIWLGVDRPCRLAKQLARHELQFIRAAEQYVERGFELKDGFKNGAAAENVETETCPGEGDGEASDVAEVADCAGAD